MFPFLLLSACRPDPTGTLPSPTGTAPVCSDWAALPASAPVFGGDVAECSPGDLDPDDTEAALDHINFARQLAGLPAFTLNHDASTLALEAAVLMEANDRLSHSPDDTWACYTEQAAQTAEVSLLAKAPAVEAVGQYLVDFGNATTLTHRRWLLSDWLDTIGIGGTLETSAVRLEGPWEVGNGWTAWPPEGAFPAELAVSGIYDLDGEGWSIQSDDIDLSEAEVTVTTADGTFPQAVEVLAPNFGSIHAIRFLPDGFSTTVGSYTVDVAGVDTPFSYTVDIVACTP